MTPTRPALSPLLLAACLWASCATTVPQTTILQAADAPPPELAPPAPPPALEPPPPALCLTPTEPFTVPRAAVPIEDPDGRLATFYEALARTARREPEALTRIGHWSDSTLASDGLSSFARRALQTRLGDGGHGFVLPVDTIPHYRHRDIRRAAGGPWRHIPLVGGATRDARYGLGGWVSVGRTRAWASLATAPDGAPVGTVASRLLLYYVAGPKRGQLDLRLDGEDAGLLDTDEPAPRDAVHSLDFPEGPHRIWMSVRGERRVRLLGAALETAGPGVVYDSFGILGLLARRLRRIDPEHWRRQLALRPHDLLLLQLGGNTLQDGGLNWERYRESFVDFVRLFRSARPEAPCLVLSPHDHGVRRRGAIVTRPRLHRLIALQREVALSEGCAWWSTFAAMGGEGSMGRYHREGAAYGDLRHLRDRGAERVADLLVGALLTGFRAHRDRTCAPGPGADPVALAPTRGGYSAAP